MGARGNAYAARANALSGWWRWLRKRLERCDSEPMRAAVGQSVCRATSTLSSMPRASGTRTAAE